MGFECDDCGQAFGSHGGFQVHQMQCQGQAPVSEQPAVTSPWASAPPPPPPRSHSQGINPLKVIGLVLVLAVGTVLGLVSVVALLGSSDTDSTKVAAVADATPPPVEAPAGFRTVVRADDRFSIAVPDSFKELALAGADLEAAAENLDPVNPAMADFLRKNKSLVTQARLFAFDPATGNSQLVQRIVAPGADSIMDIPNGTFSAEYKAIGVKGVTEERVALTSGDAFKVTAVIGSTGGDAHVTQHVFVKDSVAWILTYTDSAGEATPTATTVAETFRNV